MKKYYWCRILLSNNEFYYIYAVKEAAIEIYAKQGFEINIDPSQVPKKIREEKGEEYD